MNKANADLKNIAIKGTTQEHLAVEDIREGLAVMKDGSAVMVVKLSSINFDLLSEREQEALVFAYGGILNSLTFSIQIIIRTTIKDVGSYVAKLAQQENRLKNDLLRERIRSYQNFIRNVVQQNKVLTKDFYVVVPFSPLELGISKGVTSSLKGKRVSELPFKLEYILEKAKTALQPRKDHIIRLFTRLGLAARVLNNKELIQFFYEIYNEESAASQRIQTGNYTAWMVSAPTTAGGMASDSPENKVTEGGKQ